MNISMSRRLLLAVCVALLASCNAQSKITPSIPTPFPSPTQTKPEYHYDWKIHWLTNATCTPPCWEGITPGQTSLQEAIKIIENMPGGEKTSKFRDGVEWGGKSYRGFVSVEETNETISHIFIRFVGDKNISIQEAIDAFGEPPNIQVFGCGPSCFVNIIYPNSGLALGLEVVPTVDGVVIKYSLNINSVVFFKPGLNNYLKIPIFQGFAVNKWEGYGTYSE